MRSSSMDFYTQLKGRHWLLPMNLVSGHCLKYATAKLSNLVQDPALWQLWLALLVEIVHRRCGRSKRDV